MNEVHSKYWNVTQLLNFLSIMFITTLLTLPLHLYDYFGVIMIQNQHFTRRVIKLWKYFISRAVWRQDSCCLTMQYSYCICLDIFILLLWWVCRHLDSIWRKSTSQAYASDPNLMKSNFGEVDCIDIVLKLMNQCALIVCIVLSNGYDVQLHVWSSPCICSKNQDFSDFQLKQWHWMNGLQ